MALTACFLCERKGLILPMNRRVSVCRWCGLEWIPDCQTARQWQDSAGTTIPFPDTAPILLVKYQWSRIAVRNGKYAEINGRSIPWEWGAGGGLMHVYDAEASTLIIHTPGNLMEG